jgi:prepilin-type N-terminal cleavage/methylation domain-containing protein
MTLEYRDRVGQERPPGNRVAFPLIELLVVIAIIAILAADADGLFRQGQRQPPLSGRAPRHHRPAFVLDP